MLPTNAQRAQEVGHKEKMPRHAAATAARDRRRAMARGRYNHTYARPTLLRTLHAMGVSNFTHPHGARRAVLYEYQGVDLYKWDATWR